jgi:hypothetical protein
MAGLLSESKLQTPEVDWTGAFRKRLSPSIADRNNLGKVRQIFHPVCSRPPTLALRAAVAAARSRRR